MEMHKSKCRRLLLITKSRHILGEAKLHFEIPRIETQVLVESTYWGRYWWRLWELVFIVQSMSFVSRLCPCFNKRSKDKAASDSHHHDEAPNDVADTWDLFFDLHTLQIATNFFSELNQLGHGGFGPVYKVSLSSMITLENTQLGLLLFVPRFFVLLAVSFYTSKLPFRLWVLCSLGVSSLNK